RSMDASKTFVDLIAAGRRRWNINERAGAVYTLVKEIAAAAAQQAAATGRAAAGVQAAARAAGQRAVAWVNTVVASAAGTVHMPNGGSFQLERDATSLQRAEWAKTTLGDANVRADCAAQGQAALAAYAVSHPPPVRPADTARVAGAVIETQAKAAKVLVESLAAGVNGITSCRAVQLVNPWKCCV